jgi:hypothetical protein
MPTQDLGAPGDETLTRIEDAVAGTTTSVETAETIPSGAEDGEPSEALVLRTFTPLQLPGSRTLAAAEVLTFSSAIDDASAQPWQTLRIALGVVLLAAVLLLLLAVRWATDELHDPPVSPAAAALPGVEDLRSERDRLNAMLAQEMARREAAEAAVEALREEVREAHASRAWLQARIDNADASRTVPQRADRD